ncbi:MAG: diaminopimelate decarboxylase [Solirubrobacterales bacterium]|nr:diaminopimelate decarboxylase [Solirubrobacterales bacterium]
MPYPTGTVTNDRGHLEIGGCDVIDLAREFGTPAYVFSVAEMRDRARAYQSAFAAHTDRFEVLFASKALPVTAVYRLFAEEGLSVDVASGGELTMALTAGFDPSKIYMHGNNKTDAELRLAGDCGVGHLILDSFDEIERCERVLKNQQDVLIRVTPGIKPSTHSFIQTGQLDSKFGFGLEDGTAARAIERVLASDRLNLVGLHFHIGSQIFEIEPFRLAVEALGELRGEWCEVLDLGGGLGISYEEDDSPPEIEEYVNLKVQAVRDVFGDQAKILIEPGRSLVGTAGVTIYRVGTVKEIPGVRTYVAVDGGMSDNLRPMLYDAKYTAVIADRADDPKDTLVTVAGSHCESGDILIRDVELASPRVGDILLTPATGAYGHSMANNYNGMPRPPVIFCENGEASVVVRRETWNDLLQRDM